MSIDLDDLLSQSMTIGDIGLGHKGISKSKFLTTLVLLHNQQARVMNSDSIVE